MSIRAMASAFGISPTTVQKEIREQPGYAPDENGTIEVRRILGLDGKKRPSRRVDTTDRDERIGTLRAAGQSIRGIAAELDCSVGTVHRVLRSLTA